MKVDLSRRLVVFVLLGFSSILLAQITPEAEAPDFPNAVPGLRPQNDYAPYPRPDAGYVTDLASLLTPEEEASLEKWLWQAEAKRGVEIAVVTISSIKDCPGSANGSIELFARALFDKYGIGNLPKNDGVLFLVARNDRKARIELGKGYGYARDGDATAIMERVIIPQFRKDQYAKGIALGVKAIMQEFAGVRVGANWPLISLLVAIPIVALLTVSLFKSGKRGWAWACVGLLITLILAIIKMLQTGAKTLSREWEKSSGSGGSWSSSSSWDSGGSGGGFGGGSSGGGGATGSW